MKPIGMDIYNGSRTGDVTKTLNSRASDSDHVPVIVRFYEHHAQDSRVKRILNDVAQTLGHSNANSVGASGNNPIILAIRGGCE